MTEQANQPSGLRRQAAAVCRGCIEALVLILVCVSPWVFGAVEPGAEFCVFGGVAAVLVLWAARWLFDGELTWARSPVGLALAGLFLFGVLQLVPLPAPVLGWVSPATARLNEQLLPQTPEELPSGEGSVTTPLAAGAAVSVHPAATRTALVRLLAVFLLFAAVRNNVASAAALRRLAVVAVLNGFALALFAFIQYYSSPPNIMYWSVTVNNMLFGPFICRDHFPFYVNLCIGLGVGLLLALQSGHGPHDQQEERGLRAWLLRPLELLNSPAALGVGLALTLMVSATFFSLSRGGILSLVGTFVVFLSVRVVRTGRVFRPAAGLLIGAAALGLLVWLGLGPVKARLATLWQGEALTNARLPMWWDALKAASDFPFWGTGYGTFLDIELLYRTGPTNLSEAWEFAHNDYLEALVEGGLVRLLLSLLAIGLVYRQGWRALRRFTGRSAQGLVLGALFAFTTVVLHSFVDFGLHVQAIAVLATVVAAHLCALGATAEPAPNPVLLTPLPLRERGSTLSQLPSGETGSSDGAATFRFGGLAPVAGAAVLLLLGLVLCVQGWRWARAYSLEVAARDPVGSSDSEADEKRLVLLEAASRMTPESTHLHLVAGQAYYDAYQSQLGKVEQEERTRAAVHFILGAAPLPWKPLPTTPVESGFRCAGDRARLAQGYLTPALRHYLQARDQCPLMPKPHLRLAANVEFMSRADPRETYLRRAEQVFPRSPELWYLAGVLELKYGHDDLAWSSWRHSLELSHEYLHPILDRSRQALDSEALLEKVLPAKAETILAAADYLYPDPAAVGRKPFLGKALVVLHGQADTLTAADFRTQGQLETALDDLDAALTSYETALRREPLQDDWRYEYAVLLHRKKRRKEALLELRIVVGRRPNHNDAKQLLERVARELPEGD